MPEATTAGTEAATATASEETQQTQEDPKPSETVEFWKQKAREQEKRAKANADAATKLAEFEDQQKTETQRLSDQLAAEKAQREQVEQESLRFRVAAEKGVPAEYLDLLHGANEEEMSAKADKLVALVTSQSQEAAGPGPRPDLSQGSSGNGSSPLNGDPLLASLQSKLGIR